jgi:hypothetical protein
MLHKLSLSFLAFLFMFSAKTNAQERPKVEFGKITTAEVEKTKYEIDSTADAIVLYEKADTRFGYNDNIGLYHETTFFIRKKILKPSALSLGTIEINYYRGSSGNTQTIDDLKATSFRIENGGLSKSELTKKEIFDEKVSGSFYKKKFTIPNVKEGCVIDYTYSITTPLGVHDKPSTWYFQGQHPTLWSEYEIAIPEWLYYQMIMGGYLQLSYRNVEKANLSAGLSKLDTYATRYIFAVKDAPAFKNEAFISSSTDYVSKIEFELSSVNIAGETQRNYSVTWPDLNKTLLQSENFGAKLRKSNYLKETASKFDAITNRREKLEKVYYYMNRQMELDEEYHRVFVGDLKKVFENKKGTPSEQNIIMTALLREMGYEANPVILSTRDNGRINQSYPLLDRFNYTICRVKLDSTYLLLDISDKFLTMGMLPDICLNGDGREINSDGGDFVSLKPIEKTRTYEKIDAKIDFKTGKLTGKYEQNPGGYSAVDIKNYFRKTGKEKFEEGLKKENSNITISNISLINLEEADKSPSIKYDLVHNEDISGDESILYIDPMIQGKIAENPFKLAERSFPVDLGSPLDITYIFSLDVPISYSVESLPKSVSNVLKGKTGQFSYSGTFDPATNKILIVSRINLKNTMYYTEQYQELKELYNRIVQKHNEQIVLKKK